MPALERSRDRAVSETVRRAASRINRAWQNIAQGDLPSVAQFTDDVLPVFVQEVEQGQRLTASDAYDYVRSALNRDGAPAASRTVPRVQPSGFAGWTQQGMPLDQLAEQAMHRALARVARGLRPVDAGAATARRLVMYSATEIADASRMATQVQMAVDERVYGHERTLSTNPCGRCLILAGRFYRWSTGFQRHPNCDCGMRPVSWDRYREDGPDTVPDEVFDRMTVDEQNRAFGRDNAEAIRQGSDMGQVVNATEHTRVAGSSWTESGTTIRGRFGGFERGPGGALRRRPDEVFERRPDERYRRYVAPRPTAGQIMRSASTDGLSRDATRRMLEEYAYIL